MAFVDITAVHRLLALTQTFKGRTIRVFSIYNRHPEEKCFRVEVDRDRVSYKVRFAPETTKLSVATEHEAFRILRENGVAWVAHVYEFRADDPAYLIVEYESGESLDKSLGWTPHADLIISGLCQILSDIHNVSGDYFGHLAGPRYDSWQAFMDMRFWHHVRLVSGAGLITEDDLHWIRLLYDDASKVFSGVRPTLLHGDVKPANIVFDAERRRVSLVDFELARFGDVDFEWIRLEHLARRWPEYDKLVAQPLLSASQSQRSVQSDGEVKLLLYALFHVCSILAFECEVGLPIPEYRLRDLMDVLRAVRSRGA